MMSLFKSKPKFVGEKLEGKVVSDNIPRDATYKQGETEYTAGMPLPSLREGDVFIYSDYEYHYNQSFDISTDKWIDSNQNGWGVRVVDDKKETYNEILENINGADIVSLDYCFYDCDNFSVAPKIPKTVISMLGTFACCDRLQIAPMLPNGLIEARNLFCRCYILRTFTDSDNQNGNFSKYKIPDGVENWFGMFYGCGYLTAAPVFHDNVKSLKNTFTGCYGLKHISDIPKGIENMTETFKDCIALSGRILCNAEPKEYDDCFTNTQSYIWLIGDNLDMCKKLALTGSNNPNMCFV